jgi:aryl-alcohol dehydrogenase-like predicted oxidoreductase
MKKRNSLVLGTVQLGLNYGIANKLGQPDQSIANAIVSEAWKNGIEEFDTAQGYGTSEEVLGNAFKELKLSSKVKVISKLSPKFSHQNQKGIYESIDTSIKNLVINKLFCLMLHQEEQLEYWDKGLGELLLNYVTEGKIQYLGVSVYSPTKALEAINTDGIDFIQLPMNILERRFERLKIFEKAQKKGKRIYIRSVFLQGLLLMNPENLPAKLQHTVPVLRQFEQLCAKFNLTKQGLALGYLKLTTPDARVIFGAESPEQVRSNMNHWNKDFSDVIVHEVRQTFQNVHEKILNPALWDL